MKDRSLGTALVTGASAGIGAIYADRLAKRGYDLIVVARNAEKLQSLAANLTRETGRSVKVLPADLSDNGNLAEVEATLRGDPSIVLLVNWRRHDHQYRIGRRHLARNAQRRIRREQSLCHRAQPFAAA